ncbi:hypothetical protein HNO88_002212 [Novosphingobium chloroacetimidivorans]|uniref:Uncharacterized protein n=1 Tax=Novosphingobium chloroacetimidivorans TaxID=1428314 RepID=A0A7W7KAE1_9SPHN|nr:hypothetical protein [Novosphingobium chloroacetimidivorans]MBB4858886.1 hypothetical protein [Novosphingobium chloroacetimidivorans]
MVDLVTAMCGNEGSTLLHVSDITSPHDTRGATMDERTTDPRISSELLSQLGTRCGRACQLDSPFARGYVVQKPVR